jgi:hypothetical protein
VAATTAEDHHKSLSVFFYNARKVRQDIPTDWTSINCHERPATTDWEKAESRPVSIKAEEEN